MFSLALGVLFWQRCPEPRIGDLVQEPALVCIGPHWLRIPSAFAGVNPHLVGH